MKSLTLKKEKNTKGYTYKVYDEETLLCQRKSLRDYVACYVIYQLITENNQTILKYSAPFFFSRMDLVGKGDSRRFNTPEWQEIAVGLATLKD